MPADLPTKPQDVLAAALARLAAAPQERESPYRVPALASVDAAGVPQVRTIVLRRFDTATRVVTLYSDARAPKVGQLAARPRVALHVWDSARREQLRLDGTARLETDEVARRAAWDALSPPARTLYGGAVPPGAVLDNPELSAPSEAAAYAAFQPILITVTALDWLRLDGFAQRRARFVCAGGGWQGGWIAP